MPESIRPDPYYSVLSRNRDGGRYRCAPATAGPWASHLQHGGPPNALAVADAERVLHEQTGRSDLTSLRLSADFVGAVPVADLDVEVRLVRVARSAALAEVSLRAGERDCLHTRVWFVRDGDTAAVAAEPVPPPWPVPGEQDEASGMEFEFGYGASVDWHFVEGRMRVPGPAAAWARPRTPLVEGYEFSGLARAVLVADSASGISAELDWSRWSFVNVDLDVHLARPFRGEWVLMHARTQLGPAGSALARSTLFDETGEVGAGLQTLVLAPTT